MATRQEWQKKLEEIKKKFPNATQEEQKTLKLQQEMIESNLTGGFVDQFSVPRTGEDTKKQIYLNQEMEEGSWEHD